MDAGANPGGGENVPFESHTSARAGARARARHGAASCVSFISSANFHLRLIESIQINRTGGETDVIVKISSRSALAFDRHRRLMSGSARLLVPHFLPFLVSFFLCVCVCFFLFFASGYRPERDQS